MSNENFIPMYATYCRLGVHVFASNRAVIKAATRKLKNWRNPSERAARKSFYRLMLQHHERQQDMCVKHRF